MSTRGTVRNGTAVAAALIAAAGSLGAQRSAASRPRDTVVVRMLGPGMALDSLRVLLHEFDREQYGTQRWVMLGGRIDSLVGIQGAVTNATAFVRGMLASAEAGRLVPDGPRGWLGFLTQGPNRREQTMGGDLYVTQFAHPLIVSVDPQSPAEKAGITAGDVLVAYNGVDVVNHEFNLTMLLKPDSKVTVTVRRDGETRDYQLVVAKAPSRVSERRIEFATPARAPGGGGGTGTGGRVEVGPEGAGRRAVVTERLIPIPREGGPGFGIVGPNARFLMIAPNGVFGAGVSTVNPELAKALSLKAGVLVMEVPEDSPAWRSGLRAGDVITAVEDQPIVSLTELRQRVLALSRERAVSLQVTSRNQKTRTVTVSLAPSPSP